MPAPTTVDLSKPLRIFVVENHRDTREYLQLYLEALGHTVQTADSMTRALAALPTADCDVLISDIGLADGDGWLLLRHLQVPRPLYAIAMSGFGLGADEIRSQEAGYRHHLLKPIKPKELDAVLAEAARERSVSKP